MKPRVVRIVSYLPVGGVEKRLLALLKRLKEDFHVEVVCIHSRGKLAPLFQEAGIPVTVIPFKSRLHPVSLYRLASYLRKKRIDIVHTHMYRPNISGTLAARLAGVPVVISNVHNVNHWDTPRQVFMDRIFQPLRDRVIAVSHAVKRDILEKKTASPEKVVVVYNGVEIKDFQGEGERSLSRINKMRTSLGLSRDTFVVSIVARLVPAKGHKNLFKAMSIIEKKTDRFRILVIGGGGLKSELEEMVRGMGLKGVLFLGEREDVPDLLRITHVSVLPSVREGFSNAILESMAAGTPVVASDVGGTREAIEPFHTGLLVRYGDEKGLGKALLKLYESPGIRDSIKAKSLKRVEERFSMDAMVDRTRKLYLELLERKR